MVKLSSVTTLVVVAFASCAAVQAQNARVHAPANESADAVLGFSASEVLMAPAPELEDRASTTVAKTPPAATTKAPAVTTKAPAATTKAPTTPAVTTKAPATPTATTKAPATPTATTAAPATPTATTAAPATPTATTAAPATPTATTAAPVTPTAPTPVDPATPATPASSATPVPAATTPATDSTTWVENKIKAAPKQKACYRRVKTASNKACAKGYAYDNIVSCWSQCPLDYPVQCGFECLPQNKDCTLEVVSKGAAVANTALSVATSGVFGALTKAAKGAQKGLACGQAIYGVTQKISAQVDKLSGGKALTDKDKLKTTISNMDFVVYDIPAAVATCLGTTLPADFQATKKYTKYVEKVLVSVIDLKFEQINPIDPANFVNFYKSFRDFWVKDTTAASDGQLTEVTAADMVKIGQTATTCGGMIKDYFDKVQSTVADYITKNPTSTSDQLDFAILNLPLILQDLPKATVNCIKSNSADGITTKDEIITATRLITEQLVTLAKSGAKNAVKTVAQYKLEIAQFGLDVIAFYDPLNIASLVKEFLMPICPVTEYKGEIQRGPLDKALGLEAVGKAFQGSFGTWENTGDGYIYFRFKSSDTKDIKLNIMSGGKKLYEWALPAKKSMQKPLPLSEFAGKTLYIDRWRAGILNFMGTGGGSLLMWVPDNTKGRIALDVIINPTQMGDR